MGPRIVRASAWAASRRSAVEKICSSVLGLIGVVERAPDRERELPGLIQARVVHGDRLHQAREHERLGSARLAGQEDAERVER